MKNNAIRMEIKYILNSSFYILHFIKNFSASIAALQPEPAATTA